LLPATVNRLQRLFKQVLRISCPVQDRAGPVVRKPGHQAGMWTKHHKKRRFGRFVLPVITVAFLSYFGYHSVHGDLGLIATETFERQRLERSAELAALKSKREALERQVHLMSDGSLDKDMLDEIARYQLNVSRADEIVIFNSYF
jgi:cell division protein FtsB